MEGPTNSEKRPPRQWVFPRLPVRDVSLFIRKIMSDGSGERMRRTVLLDACGLRDSGSTREKLTVSQAYRLTTGHCRAEFIGPGEFGPPLVTDAESNAPLLDILGAEVHFKQFHDRYRDKRVPAKNVLLDWAREIGVPIDQIETFVGVVVQNARDAGLIQKLSGADTFVSFDHARDAQKPANSPQPADVADAPKAATSQTKPRIVEHLPAAPTVPAVHIDFHIHIAGDTKTEQIEAVFASMGRHIYGRRSEE